MAKNYNRYDIYIKGKESEILDFVKKGAVDAEVARFLGICPNTFSAIKRSEPRLQELLLDGRRDKCQKVRNALYRRAVGYDYWEETEHYMTDEDGNPTGAKEVTRKKKHVAPDAHAARLYLSQYQPNFSDAGELSDNIREKDLLCKVRNTEFNTGRAIDIGDEEDR